ncbi:MAG: aldehyde dehydrogenase family protein [Planctomycetia bacterium]|nr:aldehyde dehydrogenase family protein [Planctomycetia bacterium]
MSPFTSELVAARAAQQSWSRVAVRERLRFIRNLRALLVERADEICAAVSADIARPAVEVLSSELLATAAGLKFLEKRAAKLLAPRKVSWWLQPTWLMGCRDVIHQRPWGVVGIIGTWNYPVYLNVGQIAQALVAGNAVLWKPSENVPRTSELTQKLFRDSGFPAELLQVLPATREAGPQLAETDVDYIVFTGSDTVGRKLAARLGERLVPSTLELSGCDAMFVLADANLEMAAKAAWFGLTLNRGQTCIAVRRIFVQQEKLPAFVDMLKPLAESAQPLGLVLDSQRAHAQRLIEDAEKRGASVLANPAREGGLANPAREGGGSETPTALAGGVRQNPTILLNVPPESAICREACFAPVAAVIPFDTIDNAVSLANQSPFGLSSSIFTADVGKAKELAERIPAGSVCINDALAPTAHPATPFGGRGSSGWGVTQGAEGLLAMTVPQVVTVHKGTFRPHLDESVKPDPGATAELLRGLLKWTHARGLCEKLRGLWQMVRGIRRRGR